MKVNKLGMLIKFAAFYLCINFIVVSAIPLDDNKSHEKDAVPVENSEDYDVMPSEKPTEASSDTKPPLVFPSDDEKSTSKNDTALEILQKNSNTSVISESTTPKEATNGTSPESTDKDYDDKGSDKTIEKEQKDQKPKKDDEKTPKKDNEEKKEEVENKDKDYDEDSKENSGDDVENIQENQDQGDLEERYGVNSTSINVFEEPTLKSGHIAFIFAACLVFLSATAYVGLVLWRKSLELRYGMRQRLVTEDDYYNNNDVRFFGL